MVGLCFMGCFVMLFYGRVCSSGVTKFSLNGEDWTLTEHLSNITGSFV